MSGDTGIQGISSYDIYYVETNQFGTGMLRVNSFFADSEPTKIVANVITLEMQWDKCNGNVMRWNNLTH